MDNLQNIFSKYGYPKHFFEKVVCENARNNNDTSSDTTSREFILKIPYVGKPSTTFSNKMKKLVQMEFNKEIRTVYQTDKVGNYFLLKDNTPQTILPKVIY